MSANNQTKLIARYRGRAFTLIELMIVVAIVGILAVLAVVGVRRYLANAKSAEARNSLAAIGKSAAVAQQRLVTAFGVLGAGTTGAFSNYLCISATAPVPASVAAITGKKYQSNNAIGYDFHTDDSSAGFNYLGFACLRFEMQNPQSYQYNYVSDSSFSETGQGTAITATAIGDLNGDGVTSSFVLTGAVQSKVLTLAPSIAETNPDE